MPQEMIRQFEAALHKIPPTLPRLEMEAREKLGELKAAGDAVSEEAVVAAIAELGRQEFAHRRAIEELHRTEGEGVETALVLEHVEAPVRSKLERMLGSGVGIEELMESAWFREQLSQEEQYQVEDGVSLARYKMEKEDRGFVTEHREAFDALVKKWEDYAKGVDDHIKALRNLAKADPAYTDEILSQVLRFRRAWSLAERDPDPDEIETAIDYWKGVLGFEDEAH